MSDAGDRPPDPEVPDAVFLSTGVPRALAAPDSARNRAQAGYAISSAIAASVVAIGAFGNLDDRALRAQLVGALAFLCWVTTALLYLRAVTTAESSSLDAATTPDESWLSRALASSRAERLRVDAALKLATRATVISVMVTIPALLTAFASSVTLDKDRVTLSLSDEGTAAVTKLCGRRPPAIRGLLESWTLKRDFVVIQLEDGLCRAEAVTVRIPRADILGIANE